MEIAGWEVRYESGVFEYEPLLLQTLTFDLEWMRDILPESSCQTLSDLRFYVNKDFQYPNTADSGGSAVVNHWSPIWLYTHGNAAEKQSHVEFYDVKKYVSWRTAQPSIVLHETAHGFHWRIRDTHGTHIRNSYLAGIADGKYDSVQYIYGQYLSAYAKTNENEYFAETTEAFFSGGYDGRTYRNDYFPFTRAELEEFDDGAFQMLQSAWDEEGNTLSHLSTVGSRIQKKIFVCG